MSLEIRLVLTAQEFAVCNKIAQFSKVSIETVAHNFLKIGLDNTVKEFVDIIAPAKPDIPKGANWRDIQDTPVNPKPPKIVIDREPIDFEEIDKEIQGARESVIRGVSQEDSIYREHP